MPRRVDLPPALAVAPFRTRDADAEGLTRERLRSPDIGHPFHGVHVAGAAPVELLGRVEAFAPLLRPREAFSHTTAARLFDAQLPRQFLRDTALHVTWIDARDRTRRPGVVGHRAAGMSMTLVDGLPVIEPAHVFFQLASMLSHDDLVAVGDRWVTPQGHGRLLRPELTSIEALRAAIPQRGRGAAAARRALADVRVGPESRMETLLRLLLLRSGLPEPEINPPLIVGGRTLHPDLAYPRWRVVLEYEGDGHRTDAGQWRRDIWRREAFEDAGYGVIRVHSEDVVAEPEAFLARVCHVLAARSSTRPPPVR